jgi:hypothetical protein
LTKKKAKRLQEIEKHAEKYWTDTNRNPYTVANSSETNSVNIGQ